MSTPLTISIIIPAYNAAGFIEECLQHIMPQMGPGHEVIVIDDGSRDDTAARVQAVAAAAPHCALHLVQQANQGLAEVRNVGLRHARGDYILFIDCDDLLQPGMLARLDAVIHSHRPDAIAVDFRMWQPDRPHKNRDVHMSYPKDTLIDDQDLILERFFIDRHLYAWARIIRRDIYASFPTPLYPIGRLFEDVAVTPRLLARCRTLYYLPQVLLAYRQHPVSITRVITPQWCIDFVSALALVKPEFERAGVSATVRRRFDETACHFYIGLVKNSYQLPAATGKTVRQQVKSIFVDSLFDPPQQVLDGMRANKRSQRDRRTARQVQRALRDSWLFNLEQSAVRKLKLWQRMRRTRASQA